MSGPAAIVFDVGNVLLRWEPRALLRRLLPDEAAVDAFLADTDFPAWNLAQDAGRSWAEGVAAIAAGQPRHAATAAAFDARWIESITGEVPGSVALLEALDAAGRPLYAITNYSAEKWAETLPRHAFLGRFRDVVVSGRERMTKPDPAIFRLFLERNGLAAADCVFIDDSAANVAGARAVGMDAIHFVDAPALAEALRTRGLLP
ncbi:HAD family phosphatase [Amaricoccus sp.]|uniref:HAD family hydrolase n=1 Tax=Amaricoccus sp. TaxID=1872485 RepID=UPI0025B89151|nr:HAD family phosphatase [Amaricoccus sp.]